jgi:hypothetical protein
LFVRWIASGTDYLFIAEPEWAEEVTALREARNAELVENRNQGVSAYWARRNELAEELEALPTVRQSALRGRRALATKLAEGLLKPSDDSTILVGAVKDAVEMAGVNSQTQYADIEADPAVAAADFVETESWSMRLRTPERLDITKKYLIARTGYAPLTATVSLVCNAADRLSNVASLRWTHRG